MQSFELCLPTRVVFGEGAISKTGEILKEFGEKVFVISYERALMEKIGVLGAPVGFH